MVLKSACKSLRAGPPNFVIACSTVNPNGGGNFMVSNVNSISTFFDLPSGSGGKGEQLCTIEHAFFAFSAETAVSRTCTSDMVPSFATFQPNLIFCGAGVGNGIQAFLTRFCTVAMYFCNGSPLVSAHDAYAEHQLKASAVAIIRLRSTLMVYFLFCELCWV